MLSLKSNMAVKNKVKTKKSPGSYDFKRPLIVILRLGSLLIFTGAIVYGAYQMERHWKGIWPVETVAIEGDLVFLQQSDLVDWVKQNNSSGLLDMDLQQLREKLLASPWLADVTLRKVWPDQLVLEVVEHVPLVNFGQFVLTRKGSLILTDAIGQRVDNAQRLSHLPRVKLMSDDVLSADVAGMIWKEFKSISREFELLQLELSELRVEENNSWQLLFKDGLEINLGRQQREDRISRLVQVFEQIGERHLIRKIDLRYQNGVAVKWREADWQETDSEEKQG